jgi:hypothetical protein
MIGTMAAPLTAQLAGMMPGTTPGRQLAYAAAAVGTTVYVIGFICSFWLPEPSREELPE